MKKTATKPRTLGQYVPEIFAVDPEKPRESITEEFTKKRPCGDSCSKKLGDRRSWEERVRRSAKEISSVERAAQKATGDVSEVRATPVWERVRVQIDSGAIDTVGPEEIARPCEMIETQKSKEASDMLQQTGAVSRITGRRRSWAAPTTEKV